MDTYRQVLDLLAKLRAAKIYFRLDYVREEAILIEVVVPGQRVEIEFMGDGKIDVERFRSDGKMEDSAAIDQLLMDYSG